MTEPALISIKHALKAVAFYVAGSAVVLFCAAFFKSGPCALNLDILSFLLLAIASCLLFIVNLVKAIRGQTARLASVAVHIIAFGIILLLMHT